MRTARERERTRDQAGTSKPQGASGRFQYWQMQRGRLEQRLTAAAPAPSLSSDLQATPHTAHLSTFLRAGEAGRQAGRQRLNQSGSHLHASDRGMPRLGFLYIRLSVSLPGCLPVWLCGCMPACLPHTNSLSLARARALSLSVCVCARARAWDTPSRCDSVLCVSIRIVPCCANK